MSRRGYDAFGCERPDDGFDEVCELQEARRRPPAFCWTESEYRDYLAGNLTEGELRTAHDRALARRGAGDARAEWAEYGWPRGRIICEYDPAEDADSELTGGTGSPPED